MISTQPARSQQKAIAKKLVLKRQQLLPSTHEDYDESKIHSLRTGNNCIECISNYLAWRSLNGLPDSQRDNLKQGLLFLEERSEIYQQSTLDQYRLALMKTFDYKLPWVKSDLETLLISRDYLESEVNLITNHQQEFNALSTLIAFYSGLRAHEFITLRPAKESSRDDRNWNPDLFFGMPEYELYTVKGKGGLVRFVAVMTPLAEYLESMRLPTPTKVTDRGIFGEMIYDVGYGQSLSESFSSASLTYLGYSTGLHGLRHAYAKWRLRTLEPLVGLRKAEQIISQELGHFRPDITYAYFR